MSSFVRRLQAISVLLFFAVLSCLQAQWQPLNQPFKASVYSLSENNGTLFAVSGTGLYRSADGGEHWTQVHSASDFRNFTRLGTTLYATASTGLFTSDDDGQTWQPRQSDLPVFWATTGIVTQGSTLLASWRGEGVFASTDGGNTWTAENEGLPGTTVISMISAGTDVYLLLGGDLNASDAGVYRRNPGGGWSKVGSGNVEGQTLTIIDTTLFVWGWNTAFRSEDKGESWEALTPVGSSQFGTLNCLAGSETTLFASANAPGLFRSVDNGRTWSPSGLEFTRVVSLAFRGTTLIAGTVESGIYISHDNGATWQPGNNGLHSTAYVLALTAEGRDIYASATLEDIYRFDGDTSWSVLAPLPVTIGTITSMAAINSTLVAGTSAYGTLFLDTDSPEAAWQQSAGLPDKAGVLSIFKNGTTLLAGIHTTQVPSPESNGVFVSADRGATWVKSDLSTPATAFAHYNGTLYAGTVNSGLFTSTDGGSHWTPMSADPAETGSIAAIAVNSQALIVSSHSGRILFSNDNGITWKTDPSGLAALSVYDFATYGTAVFAATNLGVYKTEGNGEIWEAANTGIESIAVQHIAIAGEYLYIGTSYSAIWRCPISALTTTTAADPAPALQQYSLHPHPVQRTSVLQLCSTCELHNATLTISAMNGRKLYATGNIYGTTVAVDRRNLAPGVYAFTLEEAGAVVVSGTLVVE